MKRVFIAVSIALVLLAISMPVKAISEIQKTEIVLDDSGNALVRNLFFLNTSSISEFFIPAESPLNVKAYDEDGLINHSVISNGIYADVNSVDGYSFTIEYHSAVLTQKNANMWNFSYVHHKVKDFDNMELTIVMAKNSRLYSYSDGGIVYTDEGNTKIDWVIPVDTDTITFSAIYEMSIPNGNTELNPANSENTIFTSVWLYLLLVISLAIILILLLKFTKRFKKSTIKTSSKAQKNIIKTLTHNESIITGLLIKNGGIVTQKDILSQTKLPKSTLSRTIKKMQAKNIIEVRGFGMTNKVWLTDWFKER